MNPVPRIALSLLCSLVFVACTPQPEIGDDAGGYELPARTDAGARRFDFPGDGILFLADFPEARLTAADRDAQGVYTLTAGPEVLPINPSPWYYFQIVSSAPRKVFFRLQTGTDRKITRPWICDQSGEWRRLEGRPVETDGKKELLFEIDAGPSPVKVAGHRPFGFEHELDWERRLAALPGVRESIAGPSEGGLPVRLFDIGRPDARNLVMIMGGQHPPEATGRIGLQAFVDEVCSKTETASAFREKFRILVIPLSNPDGLMRGNWRSTSRGVDLNRDWKAFSQTESRLVRDTFTSAARAPGIRPFLFLDFHSTAETVLYTQSDKDVTFPRDFGARWFDALRKDHGPETIKREQGHNVGVPTSKAWANEAFGIAAITFEFSYATPWDKVRTLSADSARKMMRLLLDEDAQSGSEPVAAR